MKNIRHFIAFSFFFISVSNWCMENFLKKDELTDNFPLLDNSSMDNEFQITYKGQQVKIDGVCIGADLCSPAPTVGFYRSKPTYAYYGRCLLVQFNPIAAWNFLPSLVQKILEPVRQTPGSSIRGSITIHGKLMHAQDDIVALNSNLVNVLYHAWVGEILKKGVSQVPKNDPHRFNPHYKVDLPMGIFESDGIERYTTSKFDIPSAYAKAKRGGNPLSENAGIEFDRLVPLTVYQHGGHSPDNAVFVISKNRDLSTFWSVAIYPGNEHAFVSFYIFIQNKDLENLICNLIANSNTLKEVLTTLYDTILPKISNLADKNALRNAIIVIRDLISGTYPPISKEPSLYKPHENELLLQSLYNLKKAFYYMQNMLIVKG